MAKKKAARKKSTAAPTPKSFADLVRGKSPSVRKVTKALRTLIYEELPGAEENIHGGKLATALYRSSLEVCGLQPLKDRCNFYLMRGADLPDEAGLLEGSSKRIRHIKVYPDDDLLELPLREWIQQTVELNKAEIGDGLSFEEVLEKLRTICLKLPGTKETITWGKPHFRVGDKIFCGYGEEHGPAKIGLKAEKSDQAVLIKLPGIEKAPYVGHNGWVSINPLAFDEWDEIESLILDSFRLVAPKKLIAQLDSGAEPNSADGFSSGSFNKANSTARRKSSRKKAAGKKKSR